MAETYFRTGGLSVGYNGRALIHDIDIAIEKGEIVTLIGPNGSGKSTILKSITRQLRLIEGRVWIQTEELERISQRALARRTGTARTVERHEHAVGKLGGFTRGNQAGTGGQNAQNTLHGCAAALKKQAALFPAGEENPIRRKATEGKQTETAVLGGEQGKLLLPFKNSGLTGEQGKALLACGDPESALQGRKHTPDRSARRKLPYLGFSQGENACLRNT